MTDPGLKLASNNTDKQPVRPPTEKEKKDVAIKWLSSMLASLQLPQDQADTFPELAASMSAISNLVKTELKALL